MMQEKGTGLGGSTHAPGETGSSFLQRLPCQDLQQAGHGRPPQPGGVCAHTHTGPPSPVCGTARPPCSHQAEQQPAGRSLSMGLEWQARARPQGPCFSCLWRQAPGGGKTARPLPAHTHLGSLVDASLSTAEHHLWGKVPPFGWTLNPCVQRRESTAAE